jgi:glycosyltransferase involved in cell wall biosynthesis
MKKIFLTWANYSTRSQMLSQHFRAEIVYIYPFDSEGHVPKALVRYMVSFVLTLRILFKKKPDVIFSLNSPQPLLLAIYLFTRLFGGVYILDSHSAPFSHPRVQWLRPAYRFFASRAFFNINTNEFHQSLVESWGGRSFVISDIPLKIEDNYPRRKTNDRSIVYVASFDFDEPLEEVLKTARKLPEVTFHITGKYHKAPQELLRKLPCNVQLEGFLPRSDYLGLLKSVKAVMALTTRDFTMQMGAYEALSLEKPIITSDWPILRTSFGNGAVYVKNTSESIHDGVLELLKNCKTYEENVKLQRKKRKENFDQIKKCVLEELKGLSNKYARKKSTLDGY